MPSPRPIEWWLLSKDCVPLFRKPEGQVALVVGVEGRNIVAVSKPSLLVVPIFEISDENSEGKIEALLNSLLMAGEGMGEINGKFYGVVRSSGLIGLVYSVEPLQQAFEPKGSALQLPT